MRINLDMDGTIAGFYDVPNWLDYLIDKDVTPYAVAKPIVNLSVLARYLNKLQRNGIEIAIISWLSKNGNDDYNARVTATKKQWLAKHLPSVVWDEVVIVPYGTPKQNYCYSINDILFDDTIEVRNNWIGKAYSEKEIFSILKNLLDFNR